MARAFWRRSSPCPFWRLWRISSASWAAGWSALDFLTAGDVAVGLIKAAVFGAVIAIMGCYHGDRSSAGATGVGRAATLSMVGAAVLVLASNYILSTVFVEIGL